MEERIDIKPTIEAIDINKIEIEKVPLSEIVILNISTKKEQLQRIINLYNNYFSFQIKTDLNKYGADSKEMLFVNFALGIISQLTFPLHKNAANNILSFLENFEELKDIRSTFKEHEQNIDYFLEKEQYEEILKHKEKETSNSGKKVIEFAILIAKTCMQNSKDKKNN